MIGNLFFVSFNQFQKLLLIRFLYRGIQKFFERDSLQIIETKRFLADAFAVVELQPGAFKSLA